jgi:penicillin-binding protein 2
MIPRHEGRFKFIRVILPVIIVFSAFMGIGLRLWYLQVYQYQTYHRLSINNRIRLKSTPASRGLIFDRDGILLVDNRPSYCAAIVPEDIRDSRALFAFLHDTLWMEEKEIRKRLKKRAYYASFQPRVIKKNLDILEVARLQTHLAEFPGLEILIRSRRHYLYGELASHLFGYIGEINQRELKKSRKGKKSAYLPGDYVGKYGIEKTLEKELRGEKGGYQVEVDANGREMKILDRVAPVPGHNIYLTISVFLQKKLEKLMEGKDGAAVAVDTRTGEVLAMVSHPNFDPNLFTTGITPLKWRAIAQNSSHPLQDRAIQGTYPPGSTFKIVTASGGLEEGVIQPDTTFFCPGYLKFGHRNYRCWKKSGHGKISIHQAIVGSCDVFFYQVGLKLGVDRLAFYARTFGLGRPTGIRLPGEKGGLIPDSRWKRKRFHEPWYQGETLSIAIGQGYVLTTPLQMAMLMASVANDGKLLRPLIVKKIVDIEGNDLKKIKPEVRAHLSLSEKTLKIVKSGLWGVVNEPHGTAHRARLKDISVSGKTGTAQVVRIRRDKVSHKKVAVHLRDHAWFVAFAPSGSPTIAMSVLIEHGGHGGSAAAPIAGEFLKTFFDGQEIY